MFHGRTRSALFIDYENVASLCPPTKITNWLHWLEKGEFDEGRRRQLVRKNIYWGSKDNEHAGTFQSHGFKVTLCEKFHMLKNGADITIALDVMETVVADRKVEEFIILAKDTDYVPVIKRLQESDRKSAILVDESQERVFGVYYERADIVIPVRILKDAAFYREAESVWTRTKNFGGALFRPIKSSSLKDGKHQARTSNEKPIPATGEVLTQRQAGSSPQNGYRPTPGAIQAAIRAVIRVTQLKPNRFTSNKDIEAGLAKEVRGFTKRGPNAYLGYGDFKALMRVLAPLGEGRIEVSDLKNGGVRVRYIPKDED